MTQVLAQSKYTTQGQPIIVVPEIFQLRNDELGRGAVALMNERFAGNKYVVLDISGLGKGQPIGHSNPHRRFALGHIVSELYGEDSDGRTVQLLTPALSELALKHGTLPDAGSTYEDLAVVVYSTKGANAQLAQHLVAQAKERGTEIRFPLVIYGLKTVKDDKFPDKLRFDLGDVAVACYVPILSKYGGKFDASDPELVKTGFPSELGSDSRTSRTLYTANDGLRRVDRNGHLVLGAYDSDLLPLSSEAGRVSFVKGVAPQNLESALEAVVAEVRRQENAINGKKDKRLKIFGR